MYLDKLAKYKEECGFKILAYCLMSNHVHLLLKEIDIELSVIMKKLGTSYAYWYNRKYERCGHLFQDRYKSEIVETETYLLTVARYIHQNPLKIGLIISDWTSYDAYDKSSSDIVDTEFVLGLFNDERSKAQQLFIKYINEKDDVECLDIPYTRIIEHKHFEFWEQEKTVITKEHPKEWQKEAEPYYPINDKKIVIYI